jgi:hypothetical protein
VPHKKVDIHRETLLELLATERNYNTDLDLIVEVSRRHPPSSLGLVRSPFRVHGR